MSQARYVLFRPEQVERPVSLLGYGLDTNVTEWNIGERIPCEHCGAFRWNMEPPGVCCSSGKVDLQAFPTPTGPIGRLLIADTDEGKFFREHLRPIKLEPGFDERGFEPFYSKRLSR